MAAGLSASARSLRRELTAISRSGWDLVLLLVLPPIAIVVLALMFRPGLFQQVPMALVDADHSALSRAIARNLQASPKLQLTAGATALPEAFSLVRRGTVHGVVYIPPGLERHQVRHQNDAVVIYFNAALQTVASQAADAAQAAVSAALRPEALTRIADVARLHPPAVQVNLVGNAQTSFELFLETLATPLVLAMLLGSAAVFGVGRELADRSLDAWHAACGGHTATALAGKLAPYVLVFWCWCALFTLYLAGVRGWQVHGSLALLLGAQLLFFAGVAALSAALVGLLRAVDTALSFSAFYLGSGLSFAGATLTINGSPWFVRVWSALLPSTSYVQIQEQQWVMGAPPSSAAVPLLTLLAFVAIPFSVAVVALGRLARSHWEPERLHAPRPPAGFLASVGHTLATVARNRPILVTVVFAVVLYGFYYPLAYQVQTVVKIPVAAVDLDRTPLSRGFLRNLATTREVAITEQPDSIAAAQALLRADRVDGVVVITDGLEVSLVKGGPGGIAAYLKGAYLVRARAIGAALRGAIGGAVEDIAAPFKASVLAGAERVGVVQRALFNPTNGYGDYVVPGVATIILQATLLFGVAMFMGLMRESGPWRLTARGFLGTWCAFTLLGSLMGAFFFGFVFWFQDYPRGGNPLALLFCLPLFSAAVSALGLLVGACFDRHERSMQILAGTSIPVFFLSGLSWPLFAMPPLLVALARLVPSTTAVTLFVQLNGMGATLAEVAPGMATLALLALLFGAAAFLRVTRTEPASRRGIRARAAARVVPGPTREAASSGAGFIAAPPAVE